MATLVSARCECEATAKARAIATVTHKHHECDKPCDRKVKSAAEQPYIVS